MNIAAPGSAALAEQDRSAADLAGILEGFEKPQKMLSPKFLYDQEGSKLFDHICELPEYYLTRTELEIMRQAVAEIAALTGPEACLIEFGSGSSTKTRILLAGLDQPAAYVPVDISREHLAAAAEKLSLDFPRIEVLPVVADFTQPVPMPTLAAACSRKLIYFPGSTIGNFSPQSTIDLLRLMRHQAGEDGALLIGLDLKKDTALIERAYNDSAGITARFNLNVLKRLNREFGANFNVAAFQHWAVYNREFGRIEMHLISQCEQSFALAGRTFMLSRGESIVTEHSHKYATEEFRCMAQRAGFQIDRVWIDPDRLFSVQYCTRIGSLA